MRKEPDARMQLEEVRQRLRPLIDDPDDPLYPGSPDAPTIGAGIPVPGPPRSELTGSRAAPRPAPMPPAPTGARAPVGAAPLAPSPGPLPGPVRPQSPARTGGAARSHRPAAPATVTGSAAVGLVLAGAAVVLVGVFGGWTATRALGGQSPLTTVNVTSPDTAVTQHSDELGFSLPVPRNWESFQLQPLGGGEPSVSFVSPDGSEELTVARAASIEDAQAVPGTVLEPPAKTASGAVQLSYGDAERTSWRRIVPIENGAWTVTLTVPQHAAGSRSAELFDVLASGFAPTTA
jgi:eukaryotic-like serine/threonine-protein kinase